MNQIERKCLIINYFEIAPMEVLVMIFKEIIKNRISNKEFYLSMISKKAQKAWRLAEKQEFDRIKTLFIKQINAYFPSGEQNLRGLIEKKLPLGKGWEKWIHQETRALLGKIGSPSFENSLNAWAELISLCGVNALSSCGQSPLLQICEQACSLLSETNREQKENDLLLCLEIALKKGADPNLEGFPASPLVTLLSQKPNSLDDADFINKVIKLLCQFGADPFKKTQKNRYGVHPSPYEYAKAHLPVYCEVLEKSPH